MRMPLRNCCSNRCRKVTPPNDYVARQNSPRRVAHNTPPPEFSEDELTAASPQLKRGYLMGMAWWRIRRTPLAQTETGRMLREEYLTQSLLAATGTHRVYR